ncbi:MAG TPA: DUF3866 family protein [Bacilli bacterium]|nr:DUF3866 family protein [Bacilli bacterium]
MKVELERGVVAAVVRESEQGRELLVEVDGELERAFQEPAFGAAAQVGDSVLLNTTAVRMSLGTGGVHFVVAVEPDRVGASGAQASEKASVVNRPGHIMKMRYTPLQMAVHAVEEQDHPLHERVAEAETLDGVPVVICELHSMVPAVAMSLRYVWEQEQRKQLQGRDSEPFAKTGLQGERRADGTASGSRDVRDEREAGIDAPRIVYVMTDGAALSMAFSKTVVQLKEQGLLAGTVTVGHAYGGDLEAVNLYSGLLAARHALEADCIVVGMGPGIVGTGTRYGHTGIEVGQAVNAVHSLQGDPIVVPRISFVDKRERHQGVSHHTITALSQVALAQATVPLPNLEDEQAAFIWRQLTASGLHRKHHLAGLCGHSLLDAVKQFPVPLRTMGRTLDEDLPFFLAAGAAGEWAARQLKKPPQRYAWRSESALLIDKN